MNTISPLWNEYIHRLMADMGYEVPSSTVLANVPPDLSKGDIAYPMFPMCKYLETRGLSINPGELAQKLVEHHMAQGESQMQGALRNLGPYVNVFLQRDLTMRAIVDDVLHLRAMYGSNNSFTGLRIMIEFSAPNTNKPLHIGHLRNDVLGESLSRLLIYCGAEVRKVNLINDRGIHICKSMLAYEKFGAGKSPESEGVKGDHFVGDYYVKFTQWAEEADHAETEAQDMLLRWEKGDEAVRALWQQMNGWALAGLEETYKKTGIQFDAVYKESETYTEGKRVVQEGLEKGVFYKDESGAVLIDMSEIDLDSKVVLRADGTSVYITQDLGTAYVRHADWPCDMVLYIVAHEQNYHFTVLFHILEQLGFVPAKKQMYHIGYGMVHLPHGRMKSREGTVVDADDLLDDLTSLVRKEICTRGKDEDLEDLDATSYKVALGAVHYFLLNVHIKKDLTFNPESSIAFHGNTGPYLQYSCARIASMLRKFDMPEVAVDWTACNSDIEWQLAYKLSCFSHIVQQSALKKDPSLVARYSYECACLFSTFYQSIPIATCQDPCVKKARMLLSKATAQVLQNALHLLNIPYIERM